MLVAVVIATNGDAPQAGSSGTGCRPIDLAQCRPAEYRASYAGLVETPSVPALAERHEWLLRRGLSLTLTNCGKLEMTEAKSESLAGGSEASVGLSAMPKWAHAHKGVYESSV